MRGDGMALKLIYKDLALGAADGAEVSVDKAASFSTTAELPFGVDTGAVATLEPNGWGLSPDYKAKKNQPFAFWTNETSDAEGVFATPPVITIEFDDQYTSSGLTFRFSPGANEWCSEIRVLWYQNGAIKEEGIFYPDAPLYAVENAVEAFDKVVVELLKTSLPHRRAKLEYIRIGVIREIDGRELTGASFIHEIDLVSDTVPINVMDATFHSRTNVEYVFQSKQPVEAYDGENLIGIYYIEKGNRTGARDYTISCQDAIGILDRDTFDGGIWLEDTPISEMLLAVVDGSFELDIAPELSEVTLHGYIPESTKREALQQIAFAAGVCIDTAGSAKIRVFPPQTGDGVEISAKETYTGGQVDTSETVTAVIMEYYDIDTAYLEDADETIVFKGKEYGVLTDVLRVDNPNLTAGAMKNRVEYKGCYLINSSNSGKRARALLDYHMRKKRYTTAHVLHDQKPGDRVSVALPWGEAQNGNIVKMTVTISGINASNTEFLLD